MLTYKDLTRKEVVQAHQHCLEELIKGISMGVIRFDDAKNEDDLQARIDDCLKEDDYGTTLLNDPYVKETLTALAEADAEEAFYPEKFDRIVRLKEEV